jgi:hypothetical protein
VPRPAGAAVLLPLPFRRPCELIAAGRLIDYVLRQDNNQWVIGMLDESKLRKRVLLRMFGSPMVVAPFVLGMTALSAVWAMGSNIGIGLFAGISGLLTSAGAGLTRLLLDDGKTAQSIRAEMEQEERQRREALLDNLQQRLVAADDDPRPENALGDLRALLRAFEEMAERSEIVALQALVEVRAKVHQLFDESVQAFEETLKLYAMAQELQTPSARKSILDQREGIIKEVQTSIHQISDALRALQRMGAGGQSSAELARLREELDESLALANRVESRVDSLLDQTVYSDHAAPTRAQTEEKQKGT